MLQERSARLDVVVAAALAAVVLVVFSPGLSGPFLWDDIPLISTNPVVRSLSHWRVWFVSDFWDVSTELGPLGDHLHYYRPLVIASFALEWKLAGNNPAFFHGTNLALHAAVTVLAYTTLRRWSGATWSALVAVAFFAFHPTKSESVAWIVGRTDVMCTLAILVVSEGAARTRRGARTGLALQLVGTIVAYLTKEAAVMIAAFIAVEEWVALGRPSLDLATLRRLLRAAAPQLAIAVAYLIARAVWMPMQPQSTHMPVSDHALFFFESVGRYVALVLYAHPLSSQIALLRSVDGHWVHSTGYAFFGALSIVALAAAAFTLRKRAPAVTVGIGLFGLLLLPVSNIVVTGLATLVAERFLYAPLLGVALVVASAADRPLPRLARGAMIGVVVIAGGRALARAVDFSDASFFWSRERGLHPESLEAHRFAYYRARKTLQYRDAAAIALEAREQARRWYRHSGVEVEFVQAYVEAQSYLIPDRHVDDLRAADAFYTVLLDPTSSVATVKTSSFEQSITIDRPIRRYVESIRVRVTVAHSQLLSRVGENELAMRVIADLGEPSTTYVPPALAAALASARAGDYARAHAFLDRCAALRGEASVADQRTLINAADLARRRAAATSGPVALNLRAEELSRLEAWGRAYEVLAPYREEIERAPGFAIGFAELAYRAGEEAVARQVLAKNIPEEKIEPTLAAWAVKMGWTE